MDTKEKIYKVIYRAVDEINTLSDDDYELNKTRETILLGQGGDLDSLGLINLIVAVEQNIEDEYDTAVTLADEKAMSQKQSPFRTIGSLADYIEILLDEELND